MRRILAFTAIIVVAIAAAMVFAFESNETATADDKSGLQFRAQLAGAQEVPGVATDTTGDIKVKFSDDLSEVEFKLKVFDGELVTQSHFHCGRAGTNGPVVAFLFGFAPGGVDVEGKLAEGTLTNADFTGANCVPVIGVPINNIASLAFAARDGLIYVNVHTVANPPGEVRGQLLGHGKK